MMASKVALLLLVLYAPVLRSFRTFPPGVSRLARLFADNANEKDAVYTRAASISESITPTFYESDLYGVLGVPFNSTRVELRDAYWKIAYLTHPDRNNTPEALSVFRNASYAYKILGRDEKIRSDYDARYKTLMYIDVVEQLGRDVIKPLAMEVAMPLINMTMRGISKVALPFFKDAVEQSTAVYQATFDESGYEEEATNLYDVFERAAAAAGRTAMEQRIRRTKEGIDNTATRLETTSAQLFDVDDEEQALRTSIIELEKAELKDRQALEEVGIAAREARLLWESAQATEKLRADEYARSQASVGALLETAASLANTRNQEEEEVRRLEAALMQAKDRVRETIIKQTGLEISISFENKTREGLSLNYTMATTITNTTLCAYKEVETGRLNLAASTTKLSKDLQDAVTSLEKSSAMRVYLERRVQQLITKKANLEGVLTALQVEAVEKHQKKNINRLPSADREAGDDAMSKKVMTQDIDFPGKPGGASSSDTLEVVATAAEDLKTESENKDDDGKRKKSLLNFFRRDKDNDTMGTAAVGEKVAGENISVASSPAPIVAGKITDSETASLINE